ncbi:MAG: oligosaccharide flippase family protein [Chlorobi bacterium]|nr:oligosaccharide flippase family protein [Chlorobiota bacterium]
MFKKYIKSNFLKNILILISSAGLAQLIPFLVLPILQKYFYSPENFGLLSVYVSISLMFVKFSTFSYEFAIVNQKSEKHALEIFYGTVQILFITTILISLLIVGMYFFVKNNFYIQKLGIYSFLIPVTVFNFGFYQILRYWFNWKKEFLKIGKSMIFKSISAESLKLIQGFLKFTSVGLIIGRVFGEIISFLFLLFSFLKKDYSKLKKIKQKDIYSILKINYKFPAYTMPSGLKGTLLNVILISLFAKYFGMGKAGLIGISVSYISVAFGIISQSFSQVFYSKINELDDSQLFNILKKNVLFLFVISIFVTIFIQLIPNLFVVRLLGNKWIEFMPVLKLLIFAVSISFISSSVSFIYIRVNKQKEMLFFDIFHLLLVTSFIIFGYYKTNDFMQTLMYYVTAQVIYYSLAIFLSFYFVKKVK